MINLNPADAPGGSDSVLRLVLDTGGRVIGTGRTNSDAFPVTCGAVQTSRAGDLDGVKDDIAQAIEEYDMVIVELQKTRKELAA